MVLLSISWSLVFQIEEAWLGYSRKSKHRKEDSASFLISSQLVKVSCLTAANKRSVGPIRFLESADRSQRHHVIFCRNWETSQGTLAHSLGFWRYPRNHGSPKSPAATLRQTLCSASSLSSRDISDMTSLRRNSRIHQLQNIQSVHTQLL
jgi:hypothetical protein